MSCVSIWRCFCEQRNEPESEDPQYRKTEKYSGADFYDAYILATTQKFDRMVFADALKATADHRGTTQQIADVPAILLNIEESPELKTMWEKYRKQFTYAAHIEYGQIVAVLRALVQ